MLRAARVPFKCRSTLRGSRGVPTELVNTKSNSDPFQSSPIRLRACHWRSRCWRSAAIANAGKGIVRLLPFVLGVSNRSFPFTRTALRTTLVPTLRHRGIRFVTNWETRRTHSQTRPEELRWLPNAYLPALALRCPPWFVRPLAYLPGRESHRHAVTEIARN